MQRCLYSVQSLASASVLLQFLIFRILPLHQLHHNNLFSEPHLCLSFIKAIYILSLTSTQKSTLIDSTSIYSIELSLFNHATSYCARLIPLIISLYICEIISHQGMKSLTLAKSPYPISCTHLFLIRSLT